MKNIIKAGEEASGKSVPRKANALLDHGIKPIYEMATEDGRAINTTDEHPYLAKIYNKEDCDNFAGNVWNKEADEFNEYCTRWVEVEYLEEGDEIAVPKLKSDYLADFKTCFNPTIVNPTNSLDFSRYLATIPEPKSALKAGCGLPNDMYNTSASLSYSQFTCFGFSTINFSILLTSSLDQTSSKQSAQNHLQQLTPYKQQQDTCHLLQESCGTSLLQAMSQHHLSEQDPECLLSLKYHSPCSASQDDLLQYDQYAPLLILLEHHLLKTQSTFDDKMDYNYLKLSQDSNIKFEKKGIGTSIPSATLQVNGSVIIQLKSW